MSCGVGCRRDSDATLLWLRCRLAATAPIQPLAWEPPYAMGAALGKTKKKKKTKHFLFHFMLPLYDNLELIDLSTFAVTRMTLT